MSKPSLFSAAAVLALIATAASAQDAPLIQVAAIDEVIVEGRYLSLDKLNAVKTPTPIIDIPQSLSIISDDQIADQSFLNIGDVLRYTPGLSISQGEGHRDAIIIRGNETTADFFIDGLRDDVQYFRPLYNLEQIEILRGANALLFGRGGGGGVINRVTKRPDYEDQFAGLTASIDTFGAYNLAGDVNYAAGDSVAFRLNAFYEGLNNHRDYFDGERYAVNPTLAFQATPDTEVLFSYEYVNDDRVVDRGVPSVAVADGPDIPLEGYDNTFFGSADQNRTTLEAHILRGRIDHSFSEIMRGNLTVQYADYDKFYQNIYAAGFDAANSMVTLDGYQDFTDRRNLIVQANLVSEFQTGPFSHTVLLGAEYGDQDTTNSRNDNAFAVNDDDQITILFTDPLVIPAFAFSDPARNTASEVAFTSVYIQDQIDITDNFIVILGGRYDRFEIDANDIAAGAAFSRTDEEVTPRLGAIFKPADNVSFYASYSETFLPRSGDQFLTLDLDAESTRPQFFKNKEIGAKWDIKPELSFTAALFELNRESFTSVDPEDPAQLIIINGSETKGFELALTGRLTDRWLISSGYSYLDGEVDIVDGGGADGNRTRQTPEHMFSIWNNVQVTDALGFGLGATYQESFFVNEDNAVEVPSFVRVDAALYYDVNDRIRLQVNLENLLNEDYFPDAHSNDNISTGEPVNARFTISSRF
ncbi:TonB-dependent receptor [Hyphococcus sp.]|uniref:TonB-dependent receptor n=1 Tax=Hyphococcus sp. TaxID=2038636 RepID=UPI003D0A5C82